MPCGWLSRRPRSNSRRSRPRCCRGNRYLRRYAGRPPGRPHEHFSGREPGGERGAKTSARNLGTPRRSEEHTSELQSRSDLVCRIIRSEEHTSELQSRSDLVCRLLLEKKKDGMSPMSFKRYYTR